MFSDGKERKLLEIAVLLRERDTDFVRRLDARETMMVRRPLPVLVVIAAAVVLVVTAVAVESLIAVVTGPVMLCVAIGVLVRQRAARRLGVAG